MNTPEHGANVGVDALAKVYLDAKPDSMGLFLGAGVNLPPPGMESDKIRFKTYLWGQLMEELHKVNEQRLGKTFEELRAEHGNNWIGLASEMVGGLDTDALIEQVDAILYNNGMPRSDSDARLSKTFLDQAPTLRASICFASKIKEATATSWTFARNPKVGIVVTPNYDFFFGAGWTRYQAFAHWWKAQTPFGTGQPTGAQRPICYIHGYIPYRLKQKKQIVLTQASYDAAYSGPDAFAARTLRDAVEDHHLIFVGTSFSDPPLREVLRKRKRDRRHFAFTLAEGADRIQELGATPVVVESYGQIPDILRAVYCNAVSTDGCQEAHVGDPAGYWARLEKGPET